MASGDVTITYTCTATATYPSDHYPAGSTAAQIINQEQGATYARNALATILDQDNQIPGITASVTAVVSIA